MTTACVGAVISLAGISYLSPSLQTALRFSMRRILYQGGGGGEVTATRKSNRRALRDLPFELENFCYVSPRVERDKLLDNGNTTMFPCIPRVFHPVFYSVIILLSSFHSLYFIVHFDLYPSIVSLRLFENIPSVLIEITPSYFAYLN